MGMMLALMAAAALQASAPASAAQASYQQAESLQSKDPLRARTLYEEAARDGYAPAQAALGILLFKEGNRTGALRWLKTAAEAGEPRALLIYGTAQFNGDGVPPNRIQGYAMVRRAGALGLTDALATQSEMELVMPKAERDAALKLAEGPKATPTEMLAGQPEVPASGAKGAGSKGAGTKATARRVRTASAKPRATTPAKVAVRSTKPADRPQTGLQASASGAWRIQLGAFRRPGAPQALFARLSPRLGGGKQAAYLPSGGLTRLLVGPYASSADAASACRTLGRQQACIPVRVR